MVSGNAETGGSVTPGFALFELHVERSSLVPAIARAGVSREVNAQILALEARLDDASFLARDPTHEPT
jgi:uncharacterized membrane protein